MEALIAAFAAALRDLDARISSLEAASQSEVPAPAPEPAPIAVEETPVEVAAEEPAPVAAEESTEVVTNLDNYGPDWVQDGCHVLVNEITDAGKTAVFTFEQAYRHQAFCDPAPKPEGTERRFRNEGVDQLMVRLHGVWETLLLLAPGESGTITYSNGRWAGPVPIEA